MRTKKILKINWENILLIAYSIFYAIKFIQHIKNYGFDYDGDMFMIMAFILLLGIVYLLTFNIRRSLLEMEKKNDSNNNR